jgi:hypothetical protein
MLKTVQLVDEVESSIYVQIDHLLTTRLRERYGQVSARSGKCDVRDADLFGGLVVGAG